MVTMREVLLQWTLPNGRQTNSVFYFSSLYTVAGMRTRINSAMSTLMPFLAADTAWTVPLTGKLVDDATGQQTGQWADTVPLTGVGTSEAEPLPDATMGLARFPTGQIMNGRYVAGRCYVPGLSVDALFAGNVSAPAQAALSSWAGSIQNVGLIVWHRPKAGAGGVAVTASGGSAWEEFAVLRRRRG